MPRCWLLLADGHLGEVPTAKCTMGNGHTFRFDWHNKVFWCNHNSLDSFCFLSGVVYLQFGDEIKRALLPVGLDGLQQVRHLFNQTFPDKIKNNGNNRKTIYIKDNSCGVFYELDNVS